MSWPYFRGQIPIRRMALLQRTPPTITVESDPNEKLRQEKPAEVEYHSLACSNGIAGFLQHRLRFRQVSLADDSSPAAHWPDAGLQ